MPVHDTVFGERPSFFLKHLIDAALPHRSNASSWYFVAECALVQTGFSKHILNTVIGFRDYSTEGRGSKIQESFLFLFPPPD